MADPVLTGEEKRSVLREWEYEAREMDVAEEENMGGGSSSVLGRIHCALVRLGGEGNQGREAPTKHGGL